MPATVTLSTTTLTTGVDSGASEVLLASYAGINAGNCLWIDRELMKVIVLPDGSCKVRRGYGSTSSARHQSGSTVTIGSPEQFQSKDPVGSPDSSIPVSPWINTGTFRRTAAATVRKAASTVGSAAT